MRVGLGFWSTDKLLGHTVTDSTHYSCNGSKVYNEYYKEKLELLYLTSAGLKGGNSSSSTQSCGQCVFPHWLNKSKNVTPLFWLVISNCINLSIADKTVISSELSSQYMRQDNFRWCKLPFCTFPSIL